MSRLQKYKDRVYHYGLKLIDRNIPKDSWRYEYIKLRWWFICSDHYITRFKPLFQKMLGQHSSRTLAKSRLAKFDYWLCWIFLGAEPPDYFKFEFFRKGWIWRNHHVTRQRLNFSVPIFNREECRHLLDNKAEFNHVWADYINRKWCIPQQVTLDEFKSVFSGISRVLVKPMVSYGGKSIYPLDIDAQTLEEIYNRLHNSEEKIVVEEYVKQKGFLNSINPSSLNPVRITTARVNGNVYVCYAFITAGRAGSIVSNISSGGVCFSVDVPTGKIAVGQSRSSNKLLSHPDTGVRVAGEYVPDWENMKKFACDAHRAAPEGLNLIGWDVCWSNGTISMVEGNFGPGFPEIPTKHENQWKVLQSYLDDIYKPG